MPDDGEEQPRRVLVRCAECRLLYMTEQDLFDARECYCRRCGAWAACMVRDDAA